MDRRKLGTIEVSDVCLGTMTFGRDTGRDDAFAQMDRALDAGISFFDTAEMYPVPPQAAFYGRTEEVIGAWLSARPGARDRVQIASKISGPNGGHMTSSSGNPGPGSGDGGNNSSPPSSPPSIKPGAQPALSGSGDDSGSSGSGDAAGPLKALSESGGTGSMVGAGVGAAGSAVGNESDIGGPPISMQPRMQSGWGENAMDR